MANILRLLLLTACCTASGLFAFGARTPVAPAEAGSIGGFVSEVVYENLPHPIGFAFAPDGRIFVADKGGEVDIIKDGELLATPFVTLPVNTYYEHGLESIALDPYFETNGYVYLYYTYENNPDDYYGPKTSQLIRVTADGDVADPDSKVVLLGTVVGDPSHPSCQNFPAGTDCIPADSVTHLGGGLLIAPDGALILSTGDAALVDYVSSPSLVARTQDLDSLAGKLLRIDSATGAGLPDNPLYTGEPSDNRSKILAYGFRNPFRIAVDPATGQLIVADVGSDQWEELDTIEPGGNYGWPCYEGVAEHPTQNTLSVCQALYASGAPVVHPLYSYSHDAGATVIAGQFYHGYSYPSDLEGAFFFSDFVRRTINVLPADPDTGALLVDRAQQLFAGDGAGYSVAFQVGLDGDIYYTAWDGSAAYGQLRHIRFVAGDRPPVARVAAAPRGGLAPLPVHFSSDGSFDPDEGDTASFGWDFGDGTTSTNPNPVHTFTQSGIYLVQLTVTDQEGAMGAASVFVIVGNRPPVAAITAPPDVAYQSGQSIAFSGTGQDSEDGRLSPSHLHWTVVLHHCFPATHSCHTHPFLETTGASGTLIAPAGGTDTELVYLELQLTATDSAGLSATVSVPIGPASDRDGDGVLDYQELAVLHTDLVDPDSDHNGINDGAEDFDGDSCKNARELGANARQGGLRDPYNFWDYFDTPDSNNVRDHRIRVDDVVQVVRRYRADDAGGTATVNRNSDPFSMPPPTGYDPAFDRGVGIGPQPRDLGAPDGKIRVDDLIAIIRQYHHDCA